MAAKTKYISLRPLFLAALAAAAPAAGGAAAQETAAGSTVNVDTLTLTIAEVQRLALTRNPVYLAESQELPIASGELRQARVYRFNPQLGLNAPGSASDRALGEYEATLDQQIEWAGQRGLRIDAAKIGVTRAGFIVQDAARLTLSAATQAFYTALAARERLRLAEQLLVLNERLLQVVRIQALEGEISRMEANLADIEAGRSRARVLSTQREAQAMELELKRLVGLIPEQAIRLNAPDWTIDTGALQVDSLVVEALERRPDLAARTAAEEQASTLTRLARREAIPDLTLGGLVRRETEHSEPRFGIRAALPLPFWNRNQGLIAQREALARQAGLERAAAELDIRAEVVRVYQEYTSARREVEVYEESVLLPARENQQLLEAAFAAGKVGMPTLILLRNQLLEAELGYWEAWLAERRAAVSLQSVTGAYGVDLNTVNGK